MAVLLLPGWSPGSTLIAEQQAAIQKVQLPVLRLVEVLQLRSWGP